MGIIESLRALGIITEDPKAVAEGINRLIIPRLHKLRLLEEYAADMGIEDLSELKGFISKN